MRAGILFTDQLELSSTIISTTVFAYLQGRDIFPTDQTSRKCEFIRILNEVISGFMI